MNNKENIELKSTITEMKNSLQALNRFDLAEESVSKHEDRS